MSVCIARYVVASLPLSPWRSISYLITTILSRYMVSVVGTGQSGALCVPLLRLSLLQLELVQQVVEDGSLVLEGEGELNENPDGRTAEETTSKQKRASTCKTTTLLRLTLCSPSYLIFSH
jgi:hypothetical protein